VSRAGLPAASQVTPGLCSQSLSVPRLPGRPAQAAPRGARPPGTFGLRLQPAASRERTMPVPAHPQSHPKT